MTIYRYTFADQDGNEWGTWTTNEYSEAVTYAMTHHLRVIEHSYDWVDSEVTDDFTVEVEGSNLP